MFKKILSFLFFIIVLGVGVIIATYVYIKWPVEHENVSLTIKPGTSLVKISETLEENGIITCGSCFRVYVLARGMAHKLRAGDYEFESGLNADQIIKKLLKGDFKTFNITIPEGWTVSQIAGFLPTLPFVENKNIGKDLRDISKDTQYLSGLNIAWKINSLEGYLFPDTYKVYKLSDVKKLISQMVDEFNKKFTGKILEKAPNLNLTPAEIVILASIIEKETGVDEERPIIASVFYNRLKKGMPLQSDPTVIYGIEDFNGNLTKKDLEKPHPYNTYVIAGMPVGPICNPGKASLEAALNPAKTNYLFFVSKNDGSHKFSKTYAEHSKAVYEYQIEKKSP